MNNTSLDLIKEKLCNAELDDTLEMVSQLVVGGDEEVIPFLISSLNSEEHRVRNGAALVLREQPDCRAVEPLINNVINPIDSKKCATFVYALETHDCSEHFLDIFKILFYSNFECKVNAHNILAEQQFRFTDNDLYQIKEMWNECIENPNICPAFENMKEGIQDDVESFLYHLTEEN
jgi:hypothetical protein